MDVLFYAVLASLVIAMAFIIKDRNLFITLACSILIIQILVSPKVCMDGAIDGAALFFYKVFPSLFSFLIVSNVIIGCNGITIYSKFFGKILCRPLRLPKSCSFSIVISILCGYPLGAKYACDLYAQNEIDKGTLQRLLNIASNSSPLFILGSVGISMFKNSDIGYLLLLSNLISCMIMGLILPADNRFKASKNKMITAKNNRNIGKIFKDSIENSIKTCLSIGGFVTVFSVVNNILVNNSLFNFAILKISKIIGSSQDLTSGTILGMIEMTNGCNLVSSSNAGIHAKIAIVSFLFTFSGFSIISQVYSFTYKFKVSMVKYICRKFIHGLICSGTSLLIFVIYERFSSIETFFYFYGFAYYKINIFISAIFLMMFPVFVFKLKNLFFHVS